MPFVPVLYTVLVEIRMTADLQQVENTLYFEGGVPPNATSMTTLGENVLQWWEDNIRPLVWSGVVVREVVVTDLTTNTGPQVSVVPASPLTGALSTAPLPTGVSLTISFRTALRGRSFRGRNYIVGLVEAQTSGANEISSAEVSAFVAAYESIFTTVAITPWTWVVVSRFSGIDGDGDPIPRVSGVTTPITTVLVVDPVVDFQRRRLPGRGN